MKTKLGNEDGFSFLEITLVFSAQLDKAKIARAKHDVQLIAGLWENSMQTPIRGRYGVTGRKLH